VSCPDWIPSAAEALDITAVIVAGTTVLMAAEILSIRSEFGRRGVFSPRVLAPTQGGAIARWLPPFSLLHVAAAQVVLGVAAIMLMALDVSVTAPFVALAVLAALWQFRLPFGADGSDVMARTLTITVAITLLLEKHTQLVRIALLFIAAQLCLAYGASGVAKLWGKEWRDGTAIPGIVHTAFGHPGVLRTALDRWPTMAKLVTWLVVAIEIAFPLGIVLGGWIALAALAAVAALQMGIAVAMGLNRFTPWFVACFPATAWATCSYGVLTGG
jgi:hypothetical protein